MLDDDHIPPGAGGFRPDPAAWGRYGALVRDTLDRVGRAGAEAKPTAMPQPVTRPASAAEADTVSGYGARGDGDLCDLVAALQSGDLSCSETVEQSLTRAETSDGALHAIVQLEHDRARAAAAALDALPSVERGLLAGAPYARKDLFYRQGHGAECGARLFAGNVATETATVIERLDAAGGVDIGRMVMAELALSPTGYNVHAAHPANPWNLAHVTGGSSSGSGVAVAAGYVRAALGTDTGGSIRHPAALCGITGLKPTQDRVSRAGVWPLSWSLDCVGPLARSARDCALLLEIMSGPDPRDTTVTAPPFRRPALTGDVSGRRIAVPGGYYAGATSPAVAQALAEAQAALRTAGAEIVETTPPDIALVNAMAHLVLAVEASAQLAEALRDPACNIARQVRDRVEPGMFYPATLYADALRLRPAIRASWLAAVMADCDAAFLPAIPCEVPTIAETTDGELPDIAAKIGRITHANRGINYLGLPALALPCGFDAAGLPIGFQLVGRPDDEATLIAIGDAYQQATDWHTRTPTERTTT